MNTFHNQPRHTFYKATFDKNDAFFNSLNEIAPVFHGQQLIEQKFTPIVQSPALSDCKKPKIYKCPNRSIIPTQSGHKLCLEFLDTLNNKHSTEKCFDKPLFRNYLNHRNEENEKFNTFVFDYVVMYKHKIYEPSKRLDKLYNSWFQKEAQKLLASVENMSFNTFAGLPRFSSLSTTKSSRITEPIMLIRKGWVLLWPAQENLLKCTSLYFDLETHIETYLHTDQTIMQTDCKKQCYADKSSGEVNKFYIPLESLLFIISAGDYVDLPSEMLMYIEHDANNSTKTLICDKPIPSRNCGWHTNNQIVTQAFQTYVSSKGFSKWLEIDNKKVILRQTNVEENFEDYIETNKRNAKNQNHLKTNYSLVKWLLQDEETDEFLCMYTPMHLPASLNEDATELLGSFSIKLENKPDFGCEIMTKYELLKIWLELKLISSEENAKCLRISADKFETQLFQKISLRQIEEELEKWYCIEMSNILAKLQDFLKDLIKNAPGNYMLRYSKAYKNNIMLCKPATETRLTTLSLQTILDVYPSNFDFLNSADKEIYLPISNELISIVHREHNVLPGMFLPNNLTQKTNTNRSKKKKKIWEENPQEDFLETSKNLENIIKNKLSSSSEIYHEKEEIEKRGNKIDILEMKILVKNPAEEEKMDIEKEKYVNRNKNLDKFYSTKNEGGESSMLRNVFSRLREQQKRKKLPLKRNKTVNAKKRKRKQKNKQGISITESKDEFQETDVHKKSNENIEIDCRNKLSKPETTIDDYKIDQLLYTNKIV